MSYRTGAVATGSRTQMRAYLVFTESLACMLSIASGRYRSRFRNYAVHLVLQLHRYLISLGLDNPFAYARSRYPSRLLLQYFASVHHASGLAVDKRWCTGDPVLEQ